jgi:sortase A
LKIKPWFNLNRPRGKKVLLVFALLFFAILVFVTAKNYRSSADVIPQTTGGGIYLPDVSYGESDFLLRIDKIDVVAPVITDVDGADKEKYFASLQKGAAHMLGTAKPDEKGNVVIFGHSNFYEDDPGLYKTIFKHLDQLNVDDEIIIRYKGSDYKYKVVKSQIVKPTDTWVISADYNLTLLTCWPPGTTDKRIVIFANKENS